MAPSIDRFVRCVAVLTGPLARMLLPSVAFVAVDGVSVGRRSLVVLPASDNTDGGRAVTLGVPKMEDSRREAGTLAAEAGVLPAVPRTPMRRLSYTILSARIQ